MTSLQWFSCCRLNTDDWVSMSSGHMTPTTFELWKILAEPRQDCLKISFLLTALVVLRSTVAIVWPSQVVVTNFVAVLWMFSARKTPQPKHRLPVLNWVAMKSNQVKGTVFSELDDEKLYSVSSVTYWLYSTEPRLLSLYDEITHINQHCLCFVILHIGC